MVYLSYHYFAESQSCTGTNRDVRLVGGSSAYKGRVEILYFGQCVMMDGALMMPKLSADGWDMMLHVGAWDMMYRVDTPGAYVSTCIMLCACDSVEGRGSPVWDSWQDVQSCLKHCGTGYLLLSPQAVLHVKEIYLSEHNMNVQQQTNGAIYLGVHSNLMQSTTLCLTLKAHYTQT